jgi:hypothetical protein
MGRCNCRPWGGVIVAQQLVELEPGTAAVVSTNTLPQSLWGPYATKEGAIVAYWEDALYFFTPARRGRASP